MKTEGREFVRDKVRLRDKYTCKDCSKVRTEEQVKEHNSKISSLRGKIKSFDVHHINGMCGKKSKGYDKVEDMAGLITLCHKCHFNRPEHKTKSGTNAYRKVDKKKYSIILSLRTKGKSFTKIAGEYGVSGERIRQIVKEFLIHK